MNLISDQVNKDGFKYKDLPDILKLPYKVRMKMKKMNRDHRRRLKRDEEKRKERDCLFEEVPMELNDDSTDSEAMAEVNAMGAAMLKKEARRDLIDNSYNRWAHNDEGCNIPKWFKEDEKAAHVVRLPVTKEQVREYRAMLKAANARPIKKVAEAKARKKLRAMRTWNKIRNQATKIADNPDMGERTKIKQIQQLYGKTLGKRKRPRVYMLAKGPAGAVPVGGGKPSRNAIRIKVDKRMKADKLGAKNKSKRHKKGKGPVQSVRRRMNKKNRRR